MLGPPGGHGRPHPWWTPVRVLLAIAAVTFALSMVSEAPCASGAWWQGDRDFASLCHTDLAVDYVRGGLAERVPVWDARTDHEPREGQSFAAGALSYAAAVTAQTLTGSPDVDARALTPLEDLEASAEVRHEAVVYIGVVAVGQALAFLIGVLFLARSRPAPGYAVAAVAASPVVVFTAVLGWGLVPFALVAAAWWAWERGRATTSGVLVGVAAAFAFWPLLLLVAYALGTPRRPTDAARAAGSALAAWVALAVAGVVVAGGGVFEPAVDFATTASGTGSIWAVLEQAGLGLSARATSIAAVGCLLVVVGLVSAYAWRPRAHTGSATLALLLVVGWLVVAKTYEPQLALALLALGVLAGVRWRDLLIWQAGEVFFVVALWWHLGGFTLDTGEVDRVYAVAILVRIAAQLWLAAAAVGVVVQGARPTTARGGHPSVTGSDRR